MTTELHVYEQVTPDDSPDVQFGRLKVPGGWIYMTFSVHYGGGEYTGQTVSQTFVPCTEEPPP